MPTVNLGRVKPIYKGIYSPATAYVPLDFVSYNGVAYFCTAPTTGNAPTNATYWQPVVDVATWASLVAAPSKIPLADANGMLDPSWYAAFNRLRINDIGVPGQPGFGVGVCPQPPAGYTPMSGVTDVLHANYGNYEFTDGSVMVWIPAFFVRWAHAGNPSHAAYGANSVDVKPLAAYPDDVAAEADGYHRHRAFYHAGAAQPGFFYDKYKCSNNSGTASSLPLSMPLVSGPQAGQTGFSSLTGSPTNNLSGALAAARTRGAEFFPATVFMRDALATLAMAHAQRATGTRACAWYDPTGVRNFPLGCNNALRDINDTSLTFVSAGASAQPNMPLTGSASVLAKTTHNGQDCGVADVNGTVWDINVGVTTIVASKTITAATKTNPVTLTVTAHGLATGAVVHVAGLTAGMTQINDRLYTVSVIDADTISLDGVDGTAFSDYTTGGQVRTARFYALTTAADMTAVTAGNSGATDLWGAAGVAALYDEIFPASWRTDYSNNATGQRYGNAAAQVFGWDTAAARLLTMSGFPVSGAVSPAGSNLFGQDQFFQFFVDQLCVLSGGPWGNGTYAGVRARALNHYRTNSSNNTGFVAASYLP